MTGSVQMTANTRLNLKRNPRMYVLAGSLFALIGLLMLFTPDKLPEHVIFGSLFAIGGLMSLTYVNRLSLDKTSQELVHQRGLIVPFQNKRFPLRKIRAVKMTVKVVRNGDKSKTTYPVGLDGIKDAVVLNHGNPWFARVVAEQLARLINRPLISRVYGVSSTRKPDELDLPLIDRWIRNDTRFEVPTLAHDTTLQENRCGSDYELSIRAEMPELKYIVVLLWLLVIPAVVPVPWAEVFHSAFYRFFAVFAFFFATMLLAFVGRSNLRITATEVSFRQGYFPRRSRLRLSDVEEMVIAADGITLVGDASAVWIHWGDSRRDSDYLEAAVPYHLLRLGRHAQSLVSD